MRLKNTKKIKFYNTCLSPNFENKSKRDIKFIIIHYTGVKPFKKTLEIFKDPASKVSCHWLISESGKFYKIVEEKNIAWHCGKSSWKKYVGLNNNSIGIELDNPGHGVNYKSFSKSQMDSLVVLLQKIFLEYNINYKNVLAHSDIAPDRKFDPGELFNWNFLAKKKLAFFPSIKKNKKKAGFVFQFGDSNKTILHIKKLLKHIGYKTDLSNKYDLKFKLVVEAFQRRFFPFSINGIIDNHVYQRILQVHKNS